MNKPDIIKKELPRKYLNLGLGLFLAGAILLILAYLTDSGRAAFNNVILYTFLAGLGIGSLAFICVEYLAGAVWSVPFRRITEFISSIIFLLPVLVIPLFFGIHSLFHWSHEEAVATDKILAGKTPYLNSGFLIIRTLVFLVIWMVFAFFILRNSKKQDVSKDQKLTTKNLRISGAYIPVFIITMTLTAIDWLMSLEPHWFSTIFGFYYFSGSVIAVFAVVTIIAVLLNENKYLSKGLQEDHYYSLGALLFAFTNFWAYIAFAQFLLIWYANLPEETFWMIARWNGDWKYVSILLVFVHFVIPYFGLVSQPSKMNPRRLIIMSSVLLFAHYVDLYWLIMPTYNKTSAPIGIFELSVPLLIAGIIILVFYFNYSRKNIVAVGDPKLQRGIDFRL